MQLGHHALLRRFPPDDERSIAPALPAVMRETNGVLFALRSPRTPFLANVVLADQPPKRRTEARLAGTDLLK
jgi:hypothetical protein